MEDDRQIPLEPVRRRVRRKRLLRYGERPSNHERRRTSDGAGGRHHLSSNDFILGADANQIDQGTPIIRDKHDDYGIDENTDSELEEEDDEYAAAIQVRRDTRDNKTLRTIRLLGPHWMRKRDFTIITGVVLGVLAVIMILLGLPGLYNFIPRFFFVDFGSIVSLPLVIQALLPWFVQLTTSKLLRLIIFAYALFCLLIDILQFASALYSTIYSTFSAGSTWYAVGIFAADILTLFMIIFGIWHAVMAGLLYFAKPPPREGMDVTDVGTSRYP
jgi:hypothetical protein